MGSMSASHDRGKETSGETIWSVTPVLVSQSLVCCASSDCYAGVLTSGSVGTLGVHYSVTRTLLTKDLRTRVSAHVTRNCAIYLVCSSCLLMNLLAECNYSLCIHYMLYVESLYVEGSNSQASSIRGHYYALFLNTAPLIILQWRRQV